MAQLSADHFAEGDRPMTPEAAAQKLLACIPCVEGVEILALPEAEGRILSEDLIAPLDLPGFDNSAVDGYAVRFEDLAPRGETLLEVAGRAAAGRPLKGGALPGKAVRIFTGAALPENFDTVFMQEDCRPCEAGGVALPAGLTPGANRRLRGEDISAGATALARGRRLRPEDLGLAAALGFERLPVRRRLRAAVFSTGDEIVSPGEPLRPPAVYDANRFMLHGLLRRLGVAVTDLGVLRDDPAAIASALRAAAASHDLVLTSGGVSTGEEDHVKAAIADGGSLVFWRLAVKPGRPVALGVLGGVPLIGLPGNPVAAFLAFILVARPVVAALCGAAFEPPRIMTARAGFSYRKKAGRREYVRACLTRDAAGALVVEKYCVDGAAVLTSLTRTHGFVELAEDVVTLSPGDAVNFIDYDWIR